MIAPRVLVLVMAWVTVAFCASLLISASFVLVMPLIDDPYLPMGTVITAIALFALALAVRGLFFPLPGACSRIDRRLGRLQTVSVWLSLCWIPLGALLAGNLSFTFSPGATFQGGDQARKLFWIFTSIVAFLPVMLGVVRVICRVWRLLSARIRSAGRGIK